MTDITTKFDNYKSNKIKKFNLNKEFEPLSKDIIALKDFEIQSGNKVKGFEKIDGSIKIISITDIIKDPEKIKILNEISDEQNINTDLHNHDIKRDDNIWIVAFVQKTTIQDNFKPQTFQAILKCKVSDFGLLLVK